MSEHKILTLVLRAWQEAWNHHLQLQTLIKATEILIHGERKHRRIGVSIQFKVS